MNITSRDLEQPESVLSIGAVAVAQLRAKGQVLFFLNAQDEVEIADPQELALDALPEKEAIQALLERGYDDERLVTYLKGREARKKG